MPIIAERREVWIALSDLFLDTDVRLSFAYIARVAAESKYSLEELEAICRDEVAPIVESNLLEIAGDWAGFPEDWLVGSITRRLAEKPPKPYRMETDALDQWRAVAVLVRCLRALPPEKRLARSQLWHTMSKLFLDRNPPPPEGLSDPELVEYVFHHEMLLSYGKSVDAFREHAPRMYPTLPEIRAQLKIWLQAAKNSI